MALKYWVGAPIVVLAIVLAAAYWYAEDYDRRYDADYVGSEACGDCHTLTYQSWVASPHRNMVHKATPDRIVGNFDNHLYRLPASSPQAGRLAARMRIVDGKALFGLMHPTDNRFVDFEVEYVIGYQYRQVYLTREAGGVLRRLPLQWSTALNDFFSYWNAQEGSELTVEDLWAQMGTTNSAWNLFCARCHTTRLDILDKDPAHRRAVVDWLETGIACEACHGPGGKHVDYMGRSAFNRLFMLANNTLKGRPVAYIASAEKLPKNEAVSVCGRCHGADIFTQNQDIYRTFEPGYSREGRTNDLSPYFQQAPLTPGRMAPTVEVYHNGDHRGIGMLFRSFVDSACFAESDHFRCQTCHDPHNNKLPAAPGLLHASEQSNALCLGCHSEDLPEGSEHSKHQAGQPGSYCYDCHMPKHIYKMARGIAEYTRTHDMSSKPKPEDSLRFGQDKAPNACSTCHQDRGAQWAVEQRDRLWRP